MEGRLWPLIGRDAECAAIADALVAEPPRSIVIAGAPGVGRTRLLREALSLAELRGRPTRSASASSAAAAVPLGALAPLLPPVEAGPAGPLGILQSATQAVAGHNTGPRPVFAVDDAQLLDPLSVTLLHQLAATGTVSLVLAVRAQPGVPDPFAHLWKDELATRVDVRPLRHHDTERLIVAVLGGDVHSRTCQQLCRLTQGVPQYVRELLEDGFRTGRLERHRGLWRWPQAVVPSERLTEIVWAQLGELDASEWRAMEVLAVGEPLRDQDVAALSTPETVAALRRRGLVTAAATGRRGEIRIAQPMFTAVIRSRASEAAVRAVQQQLASRAATGSPDECVRRSELLLDEKASVPAGVLTAAAQRAVALRDHPLAERLALAGIAAGGGVRAHLALVEAAWFEGQAVRSAQLAREAIRLPGSDADRARLASTEVLALFCGMGLADDAAEALRKAREAAGRSEEGLAILAATEAVLAFLNGNPRAAARLGTAVLSSGPGGIAEPLAAAGAAAGSAVTGRTREALMLVGVGWAALRSLPDGDDLAFARIALAQAEVMALHLSGRIAELEHRTAELYQLNLTAPEWAGDAISCLHRGWAALAVGRPRVALRWLLEALAGLEQKDPAGVLRLCRALTATAHALGGDAESARRLLEDAGPGPAATVFEPYVRLAEAWLAAAEGRRSDAAARALLGAKVAAEQEQQAVEALLLHDALRFGANGEAVDRVRHLSRRVDAELLEVVALEAGAAVQGAGDGLDRASHRFEELGALMWAAEAAAGAAAAHERAGNRHAAVVSRLRAESLARLCELSDTPALDVQAPPPLTSREEEVAQLAADRLTNQDIADQLVVSVRTIEAHLAHVYAKLGITGRSALASALSSVKGQARTGYRAVPNGAGRSPRAHRGVRPT